MNNLYNQCNIIDSTTCVNVRKTLVTESQHHEMIVQVITVRLLQTQNHGNLRPVDGAPTVGGEIWCFFVDSCIPVRQWADICNTRCSILSRFSHFHVSHFPPQQHGAAFSCPAISCLALSASPIRVVAFAQQTMNATDWELETSTT